MLARRSEADKGSKCIWASEGDMPREHADRNRTFLATFQRASYDEKLMDLITVDPKQTRRALPQIVPDSTCVRCDVCCRFPEADSFLRPYFTAQEIVDALAHGIPGSFFPDKSGSQVVLVENRRGEGYLCPAFDSASGRCGIYDVRPLDCQLYPLALMWDASEREVLLGWDTKCPFMVEASAHAIGTYAEHIVSLLSSDAIVEQIVAHPRLVGRFQEDVVVLTTLPHITARLVPSRTDPRLHLLTLSDAPRFASALERAQVLRHDVPAAFAFPYHYIWTSLLPYWWMESDDTFFLFAKSPDGWFMPIPPLGAGALERSVEQAFSLMESWNGPSPVSRIEHVMDSQRLALEGHGIQFRQQEGDYVYSVAALVALAGDRYKSQRALCNRAGRDQAIMSEPYRLDHQSDCMSLYRRWAGQKRQGVPDRMGALLLEDAEAAHARIFVEHEQIGVSGAVVKINRDVAAYTFGYWLTPQTWCVVLEVADRSVPGLAQWVFRETCRSALAQGALYINAMDDAGLPGLRAAKLAYRPIAVLDMWVIAGINR